MPLVSKPARDKRIAIRPAICRRTQSGGKGKAKASLASSSGSLLLRQSDQSGIPSEVFPSLTTEPVGRMVPRCSRPRARARFASIT